MTIRFQLVNCARDGALENKECGNGMTLLHVLRENLGKAVDLTKMTIRVNRSEVNPETYALQENDRITLSPKQVSGA